VAVGQGSPGTSEWRRHWTLLIPCIAGIVLCAVHGYSLGVMIFPLEQEFGWSRAEITAGPLIISFIAVVAAPVVGIGIDRYGPRPIGLFGVVLFCAALAFASTTSSNILSWWTRWAVFGIANMFILPTVWTTAINSVFEKNRGKALAFALSGTGICAAVVPSGTNFLVEAYGWRHAYIGLGVISFLVVAPPVFIWFRGATDRPRRSEQGRLIAPAAMVSGVAARKGMTSPAFLKLAGAVLVFGLAGSGVTANGVPILRAQGFDGTQAAALAGLIGIGSIIGRLGGGFLLDIFDAKKVAAISVMTPIIFALLLLAPYNSGWIAALACLILGLSVGTEVDACAYLAARHFGIRSLGTLFGAINGFMLFANGLAPIGASYVYDVTKSYGVFLWAMLPICLVASLLFLSLGRYPRFDEPSDDAIVQDEAIDTLSPFG
jgi:MFS family permease